MKWHILYLLIIFNALFFPDDVLLESYVELKFQNFKLIYKPDAESRALRVLKILRKFEKKFEEIFGLKLKTSVSIYFPITIEEFNKLSLASVPEWSNAVFFPSHHRIIIKKPTWVTGPYDLEKAFLHELSHLYFFAKFDDRDIPLWFNEGLAEYLSGESITIQKGIRLGNAIFAKKIIPLKDIDSLLTFNEARAQLAYLQCLSAVQFLFNKFLKNHGGWAHFLSEVEDSNFDQALFKFTRLDRIDFEVQWYRWLQNKYQWYVVLNFENLLWIVMVIVLLGALYAVKYRNRRRLEEWEQEETFYYPNDMSKIIDNEDKLK